MADIAEIHDQVLETLLDWKENRDPELRFTLRKRPMERIQLGHWFIGNEYYLAFSFWTGLDWVNKTQNIYCEVTVDGQFFLRFSAKDDQIKAKLLRNCQTLLGGFKQSRSKGKALDLWTKGYPHQHFLDNLKLFLEEDKPRIDLYLDLERNGNELGFPFNRLTSHIFQEGIALVRRLKAERLAPPIVQPPKPKELFIYKLQLQNVGLFDNCQIELGKRATALIGINGGGKSTLLRAIALGMVGTGSSSVQTDHLKMRTLPRIKSTSAEANLSYAGDGKIEVAYRYDGDDFTNGKSNTVHFSPPQDIGAVKFWDSIDDRGFGLPVDQSDGDGKLPYLVVGYPQVHGSEKSILDIKRRALEPNAYDVLPLIYDIEDQRLAMLLKWISEQANSGEAGRSKVDHLFGLLNQILIDRDHPPIDVQLMSAIGPDKVIVSTRLNPEGIWVGLLSTGLQNLLGWLGHLISRFHEAYPSSEQPLHEPAIVFIDEIDNYLHPEVHAKLMPILLDTFKNTQFIITSHSPVILAGMPNNDAKAYRVTDGKIDEIQYFYGKRVADLLYEDFGLNDRPVPKIRSDIDEISSALANGRWEDAKQKLSVLREILGENDPAIIDATMEIEANTFFGNL